MNQLGERLRTALEAAGMTQRELAGALEVSEQAVNSWVADRKRPSAANVDAVAALLGVDRGWLLTGSKRLDESAVLEELRQIRLTQEEILLSVQEVRRVQARKPRGA